MFLTEKAELLENVAIKHSNFEINGESQTKSDKFLLIIMNAIQFLSPIWKIHVYIFDVYQRISSVVDREAMRVATQQ